MKRPDLLDRQLRELSRVCTLSIDDRLRYLTVHDVSLPPGFDQPVTPVLITIPTDYPLVPPGIGDAPVYVPPGLRFGGRPLRDVHPHRTPGFGDWAWFCYQRIDWSPQRDDLASFLEIVRTHLTDPPVRGRSFLESLLS